MLIAFAWSSWDNFTKFIQKAGQPSLRDTYCYVLGFSTIRTSTYYISIWRLHSDSWGLCWNLISVEENNICSSMDNLAVTALTNCIFNGLEANIIECSKFSRHHDGSWVVISHLFPKCILLQGQRFDNTIVYLPSNVSISKKLNI